MRQACAGLVLAAVFFGCGVMKLDSVGDPSGGDPPARPGEHQERPPPVASGPDIWAPPPPREEGACPDLFAQDLLPTYRIEIAPAEWSKLEDEFLNWNERQQNGLDRHPWHPIVFRYRDEVVDTAMIRLRGESSWEITVARDPNPKMQFLISFNEVEKRGRFHGLRKIALDMPRHDRTFLRQRLALSYLRDLGIPAQCANNARLEINGVYYGLFTNLENLDKEFVQRVFPEADDGDLWKQGTKLKTNETTSTRARQRALYGATTVEEVEALADLDTSILMWASDALMPNSDGFFAGAHNYALYDHPQRGFLWLPYDLDATFEFGDPDIDPITFKSRPEKELLWSIVMSDPVWVDRYRTRLGQALDAFHPDVLEERLQLWSEQIRQAAEEDPHRRFTMKDFEQGLRDAHGFYRQRADFVRQWLEAR